MTLPQHLSGTVSWYTPPNIIERVRTAFDAKIDLDPASCADANMIVGAKCYFTEKENALVQEWNADNVFLNPPYGRKLTVEFVDKFLLEHQCGAFKKGILLINSNTATAYWQRAWEHCNAICLPRKRIAFIDQNGKKQKSPPNSNTLFYVGNQPNTFIEAFKTLGVTAHL